MRHQLVCSSANPDKVAEIAAIVGGVVDLLPRPPEVAEVVEDADTLEGNARLKAEALVEATGLRSRGRRHWAVRRRARRRAGRLVGPLRGRAGDLRGQPGQAPGARSTGVPAGPGRAARFVTVALVRWPDGRELSVEGVSEGEIAVAERGSGGFGYDPLFVPADGDGRTFAEMTDAEKHALSQRGRAFRALMEALRSTPG